MLDLTGLPALDLAIGLAFIFFLLSTLAATIQEFIAAILGLRARTLEQGLRSLLEDPERGWAYVDEFYDHALIRSLYRTPPPAVLRAEAQRDHTAAGNGGAPGRRAGSGIGQERRYAIARLVPAGAGVLQADTRSLIRFSSRLRACGARQRCAE